MFVHLFIYNLRAWASFGGFIDYYAIYLHNKIVYLLLGKAV